MEFELLVALCRSTIFSKTRSYWFDEAMSIDWDKFITLTARHRVRPLAYFGICNSSLKDEIPKEIIEKLKSFTFQKATFNLNQSKEILRVIRLFEAQNIRVVPYKGVVLAQDAYNNIASREFSDIDVMIRKDDLAKIIKCLSDIGYQPEMKVPDYWLDYKKCDYNFDFFENGQRSFHLEAHWSIGAKLQQLNFSLDDFEDLIIIEEFLNESIEKPTPEGLFITTCIHHVAKEKRIALKHVCDLTAILHKFKSELNWNLLLEKSRKLDIENIILLGIDISNQVFGLELPPQILKKIENPKIKNLSKKHFASLYLEKYPARSISSFMRDMRFLMQLRKSWFTKLKIVYYHFLQILLPNISDFPKDRINRWKYFLLFFKKPVRLWNTYLNG